MLGALLEELRTRWGRYELLEHWKQGEFHHDVVVRVQVRAAPDAHDQVLVIATNCNGGVKEVLAFDDVPARAALWHWRCPDAVDFAGELLPIRARVTTHHWFDPCELLARDARSELREEFRERQQGGGWQLLSATCSRDERT